MKGFKYILAMCLASLAFGDVWAAVDASTARATVRRDANGPSRQTVSRTTGTSDDTIMRNRSTVSRTATTPTRTANVNTRPVSRSAVPSRTNRTAATTGHATTGTLSRVATNATTVANVLSKNYSACRNVFNDCMDEFCANKDSQLKRCACSARVNDFDSVKRQLSTASDKLLDFGQRLLTISLDKEDALAINTETAGEIAFNSTPDKTQSKKTLDAIANKLNTSFSKSNFAPTTIRTFSLNKDAAFDSVDSLAGASTTAKSGPELHAAALPVCREIAREVCSDQELSIAESSYQLLIEQDCTTVEKSYKAQIEETRDKIFENQALLDISRLDNYQNRNSDDILTCKAKMLDTLTNSTVCGTNLEKCLDTTGRYIDPSTGAAFLTPDLTDLAELIVRPDGDQTWANANSRFVTFLNSKRKYLEPSMAKCQDISDTVWDAFIEDALAQIKLAQTAKLEDVRHGCTTLSAQCLSDATQSIADFDSRALSIFGIAANKTATSMCDDILYACSAVMEYDAGGMWTSGMAEISTIETYENIMNTCREIGRNCIIRACSSISGNFGLCEDVNYSINRKAILNRTSCWGEVHDCVASAGSGYIANILETPSIANTIKYDATKQNFYTALYGDNYTPIKSLCSDSGDYSCILAEKIWGNCEYETTDMTHASNKIKKPIDGESTLLYWFAQNTNTTSDSWNCKDNTCPSGFIAKLDDTRIKCVDASQMICGQECTNDDKITVTSGIENCTEFGQDFYGNGCFNNKISNSSSPMFGTDNINGICTASDTETVTYIAGTDNKKLVCLGTTTAKENKIICNGKYVVIENGVYKYLNDDASITNFYYPEPKSTGCSNACEYGTNWGECTTPDRWLINFN